MDKRFFHALSILVGTIIGVGLFSLPYITSKVGIWTMLFYFLILGGVTILITLIYGEITLRTKGVHRFPGYAKRYLGQWGGGLALLTSILGLMGAILAYLVVGGQFLFSLLAPSLGGTYSIYVYIYFALGVLLIYFGIKSIAQVELILTIFFFVVLFLILHQGFDLTNLNNLLVFDSEYLFLPYGAILFSLSVAGVIPEIKEMLKNRAQDLKKIIYIGIILAIITYLFFILAITGITGEKTSVEAIVGLNIALKDGIVVVLALVFGLLATFTSYLTIGLTLKKVFWYDLKLNKDLAWVLACFPALMLFLLGFKDFIVIVSLVGGVALAIRLILTLLAFYKAKEKGELEPAYSINLPKVLAYFLIFIFILGIIYEIYYSTGI